MNDSAPLDRETAETYAAWFKDLADGTRVQVVSLLARRGRTLAVGEIVAACPGGGRRPVRRARPGGPGGRDDHRL